MMRLYVTFVLGLALSAVVNGQYASEEEAIKAAEEQLAAMGDVVSSPSVVTGKAEAEALRLANEAKAAPEHSDMTGVKVELGEVEGVESADNKEGAAVSSTEQEEKKTTEDAVVEKVKVDTHNEGKEQRLVDEVTDAKRHHLRRNSRGVHLNQQLSVKPAPEMLPDGSFNLLDDEGHRPAYQGMIGSRPSAPQFGGMGGPPSPLGGVGGGSDPFQAMMGMGLGNPLAGMNPQMNM